MQAIAREIITCGSDRVHIGLDYFDATINRIAAWCIGTRNMQKALLKALLEPAAELKAMEKEFNGTKKLAMLEELKAYPWGAVYDYFCEQQNVPSVMDWLNEVNQYEKEILFKR